MIKKIASVVFVVVAASSSWVYATDTLENKVAELSQPKTVDTLNRADLKEKLSALVGLEVEEILSSPIKGIVELVTKQGLFYATEDGAFLIQGKMYGLGKNITNHTEESLASVRMKGMAKFENDMIVFPAKNEKHVITVFTDITCGYCRQMHEQMSQYNDLGITVRYMAYPRSGIKDQLGQYTQGYNDLRSIWCHETPKSALTKAKLGSSVAQRICDKPISEEFNFGRQVGVNSTPTIILESGFMLPGYRKPEELIQILESFKAQS